MEYSPIPGRSALISPELEAQLKPLLTRIERPVVIASILDEGEKSLEMGALIRHLASLCDRIETRFLRPGEDPDADRALDASLLPATGFSSEGIYGRIACHGVPGGKEFNGFIAGLLGFAGAAKPLDAPTLKDIRKIKTPATLHVCVSLACHHCASEVAAAQRIALESPLVEAHMVDANLYPALVKQHSISRVPLLLLNGEAVPAGELTLAELVTLLKKR